VFSIISGCPEEEVDEGMVADFCHNHAINCSLEDAALIISQYDESGNGKLTFGEFCSLILSATDEDLREMAIDRDSSDWVPHSPQMDESLKQTLSILVLRELDYQRNVDDLRTELRKRRDMKIKKIFKVIDNSEPKMRMDRYDIRYFVNEHLKYLEDDELDAIIRR